jgi:hypothetical protein
LAISSDRDLLFSFLSSKHYNNENAVNQQNGIICQDSNLYDFYFALYILEYNIISRKKTVKFKIIVNKIQIQTICQFMGRKIFLGEVNFKI